MENESNMTEDILEIALLLQLEFSRHNLFMWSCGAVSVYRHSTRYVHNKGLELFSQYIRM